MDSRTVSRSPIFFRSVTSSSGADMPRTGQKPRLEICSWKPAPVLMFTPPVGMTILHWNGAAWTEVEGPQQGESLASVDMVASDDGWAVGDLGTILHWDGVAWTMVREGGAAENLDSANTVAANDGWAVGDNLTILHWDGATWTPVVPPTRGFLYDVAMSGSDDGWAVGGYGLILHWPAPRRVVWQAAVFLPSALKR